MSVEPVGRSVNFLIGCVYFCACVRLCFLTAPSVVPIMHQVSSTSRSFSLSWPPPEQPNGIILDYEIRFYDKVDGGDRCLRVVLCCFLLLSANNPLEMIKRANRYRLKIRHYQGRQRGTARATASSRFPLLITPRQSWCFYWRQTTKDFVNELRMEVKWEDL